MQPLDRALQALAVSKRRQILRLIETEELSAGDIAHHFRKVSRPAISQHLKVLTQAGLVRVRRAGTRRLYTARPEGLSQLRDFLNQFWTDELQSLKQAAEAEERKRQREAHLRSDH